jgi:hypothetical protein
MHFTEFTMIYHVDSERIGVSKRIARVAFLLVVYVLVLWVAHVYWSRSNLKSGSLEEYIVDAVVFAAIAYFADSIRRDYDLEVNDEIIRIRGGFSSHQVRRGRIRYWREHSGNFLREPGLWLSEGMGVRRVFSGYVFVPASLPEYQQIKAKAMSWRELG